MKHKFPLLFKNNKSGLNLHKHEPKMKYRQYLHNILIHLHFRNFNNFLNLLTRQLGISEHVILMLSLWIAFAIVNNRIVDYNIVENKTIRVVFNFFYRSQKLTLTKCS